MMIFLALYSRAQLLLSARKSPTKNSALLFSKRSQTSAFVVWREDRETFPENDAFRMKDTHATTTTTTNRFRIKSQRRGKMFDEFFPQTKKVTHSVVARE
jgi:hypothetical protein